MEDMFGMITLLLIALGMERCSFGSTVRCAERSRGHDRAAAWVSSGGSGGILAGLRALNGWADRGSAFHRPTPLWQRPGGEAKSERGPAVARCCALLRSLMACGLE